MTKNTARKEISRNISPVVLPGKPRLTRKFQWFFEMFHMYLVESIFKQKILWLMKIYTVSIINSFFLCLAHNNQCRWWGIIERGTDESTRFKIGHWFPKSEPNFVQTLDKFPWQQKFPRNDQSQTDLKIHRNFCSKISIVDWRVSLLILFEFIDWYSLIYRFFKFWCVIDMSRNFYQINFPAFYT